MQLLLYPELRRSSTRRSSQHLATPKQQQEIAYLSDASVRSTVSFLIHPSVWKEHFTKFAGAERCTTRILSVPNVGRDHEFEGSSDELERVQGGRGAGGLGDEPC